MNILTAYNRGLIRVGANVITNGNGCTTLSELDQYLKGKITSIRSEYFIIKGDFYNKTTKLRSTDAWGVDYDNEVAYIRFNKPASKISPYAYWLMRNNL